MAVGAPRADNGAVYIFNGGKNGLERKYSQVIYASDVPNSPRGFGMSIASGIDVDGNKFNDIAIGAHLDARAFIFKTRGVINIVALQMVNMTSVPPEEEKMNCNWKKVWYHCIALDLDLAYHGEGASDSIVLDVTFSLDDKSKYTKRARMVDRKTNKLISSTLQEIKLRRNDTTRISFIVYISIGLSVPMQRNIALLSSFKARHDASKCGDIPCGILNKYSPHSVVSYIKYEHRCGDDGTCDVDQRISAAILFPDNQGIGKIIYGKVNGFILNATVINLGEPAFSSNMTTVFSDDFLVDRVEINGKASSIWNVVTKAKEKHLSFLLANPLIKGNAIKVAIKISVPKSRPSLTTYAFDMMVASSGKEINIEDNSASISVESEVDACIHVNGDVFPSYILLPEDPKESSTYSKSQPILYDFNIHNGANVDIQTLGTDISVLTETNGVRLLCVSNITVDDLPCSNIPQQSSCEYVLKNMKSSSGKVIEPRENLTCNGDTVCEQFQCTIPQIPHGQGVQLQIQARILEMSFAGTEKISLGASVQAKFEDEMFVPRDECQNMMGDVSFTVEIATIQQQAKQIQLWIIIVAALVALFLLALLIFVLYKKGFFNRKRPDGDIAEEEEPMNQ